MTGLIIVCAKYLFVLIAPLFLFVFWKASREERRVLIIRGAVALLIALVLAKAGGAIYFEQRPFAVRHVAPLIPHEADNGFPSDHTLLVFCCAFLMLPFRKEIAFLTMGVGAAVGLARIGALIHSPLDICASILFAAISNGIAFLLVKRKPE